MYRPGWLLFELLNFSNMGLDVQIAHVCMYVSTFHNLARTLICFMSLALKCSVIWELYVASWVVWFSWLSCFFILSLSLNLLPLWSSLWQAFPAVHTDKAVYITCTVSSAFHQTTRLCTGCKPTYRKWHLTCSIMYQLSRDTPSMLHHSISHAVLSTV